MIAARSLVFFLTGFLALLPAMLRADEKGDALLAAVVAKVNSELPLAIEYRLTHRHQEKQRITEIKTVKEVNHTYSRGGPILGENNLAQGLWMLLPMNGLDPLPTRFPFYPDIVYKPDTPASARFSTRLLNPEMMEGKIYDVVEVTNPFPLGDYLPKFPDPPDLTAERVVARYYIGNDKHIRRIEADVTLRAKPPNRDNYPDFSTMTLELNVDKRRKAIVASSRPAAPPPLRALSLNADIPTTALSLSPDGTLLATGNQDGLILLRDPKDGKELQTLEGHLAPVNRLFFSADSTRLVSASQDNVVAIWDAKERRLLRTFRHSLMLTALALSPDGKLLACGLSGRGVVIYGVAKGETLTALPHSPVTHIVFSPDSKTLATADTDAVTRLWSVADSKELASFQALREPPQMLTALAFTPNGSKLLLAGQRGELEIRALPGGEFGGASGYAPGPITALAFSPDGKTLAIANRDIDGDISGQKAGVRLWNVASFWEPGPEIAVEFSRGSPSLHFSPDGKTLTTFGGFNRLSVWAVPSEEPPPKPQDK